MCSITCALLVLSVLETHAREASEELVDHLADHALCTLTRKPGLVRPCCTNVISDHSRQNLILCGCGTVVSWARHRRAQICSEAVPGHGTQFVSRAVVAEKSIQALKWELLRMAAALDRGQAYNPTSGEYYADRIELARTIIDTIVGKSSALPTNLSAIDGEWELVFSTVKNGIFRSSPFFLAIQNALGSRESSDLGFKLHELQTHQWGLSKVGRVGQCINSAEGRLYSEFDTSLLSMTAIPLIGFDKLLPTFGGSVLTVSDVELIGNRLQMDVLYTEGRAIPGLPALPGLPPGVPSPFQNQRVPVGEIWQRLPWNNGKKPTCSVELKYVDEDMRIVADGDGEFFVYTRPLDPRGFC